MATTAKTKNDVEQMKSSDRLWDSLNHTYGLQREEIGRNYDKAYSQADRQALSRGMQRSSYNAANLANINQQRNTALDQNYQNQIADYENRLNQQEQQDLENERWEKQFNEGVRQFNENLAATREENALNRAFQTSEREAQQGWQSGENALGRAFTTSEREAQQGWKSGENALNRAYNTAEREAQQAYQSGENAINRAYNTAEREAQQNWQSAENQTNRIYNTAEREAQQAYQSAENALSRAENARQFNEQMAYNTAQADRSADQWERSFAQDNMTADQKLAAGYVSAIVANGGIPSDELLARAGLSRADAEAMRDGTKSGGGSGGSGGNGGNGGNNPAGNPNDLFNDPTGGVNGDTNGTAAKRTKAEMVELLGTADDRLYEKMFGPSATSPVSSIADVADEELAAAFQEYMNDPEAYKKAHNLQVVDFSGKSPTGWTDEGPYDSTQTYGVAMNTNDIANSPANRLTSRVRDENIIDPNAKTAEERFGNQKKREKTYWAWDFE